MASNRRLIGNLPARIGGMTRRAWARYVSRRFQHYGRKVRMKSATNGSKTLPTIYQIAAEIGILHGLNGPQLEDFVQELNNNHRSKSEKKRDYRGNPRSLLWAIRTTVRGGEKLLPALEETLFSNRGNMTTHEIATALRMKWTGHTRHVLGAALQTLQMMGLITQMPPRSTGAEIGMWAHNYYKQRADRQNIGIYICNRLKRGKVAAAQLSKEVEMPQVSTGYKYGNPDAQFHLSSIMKWIPRLEKRGIVGTEQVKGVRGKKTMVFLTSKGKELMTIYQKTKHLPNELRVALLE